VNDTGQAYEKSNVITGRFGDTLSAGDGDGGNDGMDRRVTRLEVQQEFVTKELSSIGAKIDGLATVVGSINQQVARLPSYWGLWSALGVIFAIMLAVLAIIIAVFQYKAELVAVAAPSVAPPATVILLPQSNGVPSLVLPVEPNAEQPAP
jgi:hypothetical protein